MSRRTEASSGLSECESVNHTCCCSCWRTDLWQIRPLKHDEEWHTPQNLDQFVRIWHVHCVSEPLDGASRTMRPAPIFLKQHLRWRRQSYLPCQKQIGTIADTLLGRGLDLQAHTHAHTVKHWMGQGVRGVVILSCRVISTITQLGPLLPQL